MADEDEGRSRRRRGGRARANPSEAEGSPAVEQFPIPPELVEHILLGLADDRRVLQDSPILGDVWLAYAADPASKHELLITPHKNATAAEVAGQILEKGADRIKGARIAYLQGIVAARLSFNEVIRVLVPLTHWWLQKEVADKLEKDDPTKIRARIKRVLDPERFRDARMQVAGERTSLDYEDFTALDRYIALAGLILWVGNQSRPDEKLKPIDNLEEVFPKFESRRDEIVDGLLKLYQTLKAESVQLADRQRSKTRQEDEEEEKPLIFQVSLNRRASPALEKSVPAVKADAAGMLFKVQCDKIVWAVLDSGIDKTHEAFLTREADGKAPKPRVKKTFDFTNIRDIVSSDNAEAKETIMSSRAMVSMGIRNARHWRCCAKRAATVRITRST